jgi:branched-chain amino acid aminotransferase
MLRRLFSHPAQARLGLFPPLSSPTVWLSCRKYSVHTANADLEACSLTVEKTKSPKELTPASQLVFGHTFTGCAYMRNSDIDHMLTIEWTSSKGWLPPRILPYQNLSLDPATCVFHYAFECFEGLKAYKV